MTTGFEDDDHRPPYVRKPPYDPTTYWSQPHHKRTTVRNRATLWSSGVVLFLLTLAVLWLYGWLALMLMIVAMISTAVFGAVA